jgi:hypothetical protein
MPAANNVACVTDYYHYNGRYFLGVAMNLLQRIGWRCVATYVLLYSLPMNVLAQSKSWSEGANDILQAEKYINKFIKAVCIMSGVGLIVSSVAKIARYRQNSVETRLSHIVVSLLLGIALLLIALIPMPFVDD